MKRNIENTILTPRNDPVKNSGINLRQESIGLKDQQIRSIRQLGQRSRAGTFKNYKMGSSKRKIINVDNKTKNNQDTLPLYLNIVDGEDATDVKMKPAYKTQNVKFFDAQQNLKGNESNDDSFDGYKLDTTQVNMSRN